MSESIPAQSPPLPQNPELPLLPKGYKPKPWPEVPHVPVCPSASHASRSASSLERALVGSRVAILRSSFIQDLGRAVLGLRVVVWENMCRGTLDRGGVQGGTHPRRGLLCTSFREAAVCNLAFPGHDSAPSIPHKSKWLPCSSISLATFSSHC